MASDDDEDEDEPYNWPAALVAVVFWVAMVAICFICAVYWRP